MSTLAEKFNIPKSLFDTIVSIREQTLLNELFDKPYKVDKLSDNDSKVTYRFYTRDDDNKIKDVYMVFFKLKNKEKNHWELTFELRGGKSIKSSTNFDDMMKTKYDTTKTGDEIKVFSSVIFAVKKFAKEKNPNTIVFVAMNADSTGKGGENRINLYRKLTKSIAPKLGFNFSEVNKGSGTTFVLNKIRED